MLTRLIFLIVIGFALIFLYIKYLESKGLYYPTRSLNYNPSLVGIPYQDVSVITSDNVKVHGWLMTHSDIKETILLFHGNAGNISDRIDKFALLYQAGFNVFIIDYRGYGKSEGKPGEKGFYLDALAAYEYLAKTVGLKPSEIILYGESLGTAIAIDLASKQSIKALILEGAFSSGRDIAVMIYPFMPRFIFANSFDLISKIKNITAPVLFIHSKEDEVVPIQMAQKLYANTKSPKVFLQLMGDHNYGFMNSPKLYISSINNFIEKIP